MPRTKYETGAGAHPVLAFDGRMLRGFAATQPADPVVARLVALPALVGAAALLVLLLAPGASDPSALLALAGLAALLAVAVLGRRTPARTHVHLALPALIVLCSAGLLAADPIGIAPLALVWPLMLSAALAPPRTLLAHVALAAAGLALALAVGADRPAMPLAVFAGYTAAACAVLVFVRTLRLRVARLHVELEELVARDPLTGVLHRDAFEQAFEAWLGHGLQRQQELALMLVDIDGFHPINDLHGHDSGDAALRHLGALLRDVLRETDTVGRVSADRFALLLPGLPATEALPVAERLRATVAGRSAECGQPFTVSVGVAGSRSFSEPWAAAERALSLAKTAGRDRVVLAETETQAERGGDDAGTLTVAA